MKTWVDLYASHRQARAVVPSWTSEVRKKLVALAQAGYCDGTIRGRFSNRNLGTLAEWSIRKDGVRIAEPLIGLGELETAELSVLGLVSRNGHLHTFTVSVEGTRGDGSRLTLAVHLPDDRETGDNPKGDRQGFGACGHAALHCHVGPDLGKGPKVRVPLPALGPVEALEWVLSQLVPNMAFEPAPWASVLETVPSASTGTRSQGPKLVK